MTGDNVRILRGVAVLALLAGCAPGIQGAWTASGHVGEAEAFDLALSFESDAAAIGVFETHANGELRVPVCQVQVVEQSVRFVIDTNGDTSCSTLSHPLTFSGTLGYHVLAGEVRDATGEQVGIWRAFRKQPADE